MYPEFQYVLLGDDAQRDPYLYKRICKVFPKHVTAIYMRQTSSKPKKEVEGVLKNIETLHVECLYCKGGRDAIPIQKRLESLEIREYRLRQWFFSGLCSILICGPILAFFSVHYVVTLPGTVSSCSNSSTSLDM